MPRDRRKGCVVRLPDRWAARWARSLRGVRLTVESALRASRSEVWAAVSTVGGINREVAPFVRMTDPTHGARFDAKPWPCGAPVLWQLGLGFIPVDRHRVELVALPDGRGFRESSSSWWHRVWGRAGERGV